MTQQLLEEAVCYPFFLSFPPNFLLVVIFGTHPLVRFGDVTTEGRRFQKYLPAELAGETFGALLYVCGSARLIGLCGSDIPYIKRLRLDESDQVSIAAGPTLCVFVFLLLFVLGFDFLC